MSGKSKISWTQETWEVTGGCTPISPGCANCYAIPVVGNRLANIPGCGDRYHDLVENKKWTGTIKLFEDRLAQPLHWRAARKIFICPRSDLFHEDVPFSFVSRVFDTILECPQHQFQMLTKRPELMLKYYLDADTTNDYTIDEGNVWYGATTENQEYANKRTPFLLQIPSAVLFLSVEPMLGSVVLKPEWLKQLGWVIIGCESGKGRRRCDPRWVIDLVEQCKAAGVPYFVKQMDINGKVSKEPSEWPKECRNQDFPRK